MPLPVFPQFPGFYMPGSFFTPTPGDFCFLADPTLVGGLRVWMVAFTKGQVGQMINPPASTIAAAQAAAAYPRLMASALKDTLSLSQLTEGWQGFESKVKTNLVTGDRRIWTKLPRLTASRAK